MEEVDILYQMYLNEEAKRFRVDISTKEKRDRFEIALALFYLRPKNKKQP